MISIQGETCRFNLRVAAVIFSGDRVLMNKGVDQHGWYLPGGRLEIDESSTDSLVREIREELKVEIEVKRLLWVVEHFFRYFGEAYHEVGLYFLAEIPGDSELHEHQKGWVEEETDGAKIDFRWMSEEVLASESIYPSFITGAVRNLPDSIEHIVQRDLEVGREVS